MLAWLKCFARNLHNPVRHPLGGFKCSDCGTTGVDLEEMGFSGSSRVHPIRRMFSRDRGEFTRTQAWEPSSRGW